MPDSHSQKPQNAVFAFLSDPAAHGGAEVTRIDTHGAAVFLAGDRVLKVKRAVKFPFLDYSTLEKRKAACEAELQVNRLFAPDIYRGVVPIVKDKGGRLSLGGDGEVVEWALEMRRFDENATLDHLAETGRIDDALADALARTVAAAHRLVPAVDAEPWIEALESYIGQNEQAFRDFPDLFPPDKAADLSGREPAGLREAAAAADPTRRNATGAARTWRPASRQYRADRRQADAVRRDRVRSAGRLGRPALRPRLPADGPCRARAAARGQYRAQPLSGGDPARRGFRCAGRPAAVHVDARRDPRQGYGGEARGREGRRQGLASRRMPGTISRSRCG